jgi:hypothetical protein
MSCIIALSGDPRTSDPLAARSFKIFEKLTTIHLAGLFDSELWQEILRASHHNDALWHAATALGFAHEAYLHRRFDGKTLDENRALKQYNKAMRCFMRPHIGEQEGHQVVMTASILFMAFEVCVKFHVIKKILNYRRF